MLEYGPVGAKMEKALIPNFGEKNEDKGGRGVIEKQYTEISNILEYYNYHSLK